MNSSLFSFLELVSTGLMFIAVIYSIFSIFKVNYFNPIVQIFVKLMTPFTKIFFSIDKSKSGLLVAIIFSSISALIFVSNYDGRNSQILKIAELITNNELQGYFVILVQSVFKVIIVFFQIIFYFVIAGVIKSWVAPFSEDDIWIVVEVISNKTLDPIRKFLPAAGGLDFSPIFVLIFLNSLNIFLANLVERITLLVL
jgi:YggT family protein